MKITVRWYNRQRRGVHMHWHVLFSFRIEAKRIVESTHRGKKTTFTQLNQLTWRWIRSLKFFSFIGKFLKQRGILCKPLFRSKMSKKRFSFYFLFYWICKPASWNRTILLTDWHCDWSPTHRIYRVVSILFFSLKQRWLLAFWNKITHKGLKTTLILTRHYKTGQSCNASTFFRLPTDR